MDISDLITRYNPAPNVRLNYVSNNYNGSHRPPMPVRKLPQRQMPQRQMPQRQMPQRQMPQRRAPSTVRNVENKMTTQYNPRKVNQYIESMRRKDAKTAILATRQRVTFHGKERIQKDKRSTSRIEKHMECANTKVLRKLLRTKEIKTSRKTPPQLVDRLSKLMIGSKIKITQKG